MKTIATIQFLLSASPVPEPETLALMTLGLGLVVMRRRSQRTA